MLRISSLSLEYIKVPVTARGTDGLAVDPTPDQVSLAVVSTGSTPVSGDWKAGLWETDTGVTPNAYLAICLFGPGPGRTALTPGTKDVYVKITDAPEVPVLLAGKIEVF